MSIVMDWFDKLFGIDKAIADLAEMEPTPAWVPVAHVRTDEEAAIIVGRLKHSEIPAVAMPEQQALTRHTFLFSHALSVPILVPSKFEEAALKLLEETPEIVDIEDE